MDSQINHGKILLSQPIQWSGTLWAFLLCKRDWGNCTQFSHIDAAPWTRMNIVSESPPTLFAEDFQELQKDAGRMWRQGKCHLPRGKLPGSDPMGITVIGLTGWLTRLNAHKHFAWLMKYRNGDGTLLVYFPWCLVQWLCNPKQSYTLSSSLKLMGLTKRDSA